MTKDKSTNDLNARLDAIDNQLAALIRAEEKKTELLEEVLPIAKLMMAVGSDRLQTLEDKGYFQFFEKSLGVMDKVVEGFSPTDVEQLGDNVVSILGTVKQFTQPQMLSVVRRASLAVDGADKKQPVGVFGMMKASRDDDVKRGLAVALEVLRQVGKGAQRSTSAQDDARQRLAARLGPKNAPPSKAAKKAAAKKQKKEKKAKKAAPAAANAKSSVHIDVPGVIFDAQGFMADASAWNRDIAVQIADSIDFGELEDGHWHVIDFVRSDYEASGASPNLRRISVGADISIKEIYSLFKKAPGLNAARMAGVPKPVGCI